MKLKYLLFSTPFVLLCIVLLISIFGLKTEMSWSLADNVSDQLSLALRAELNKEKEDALRFAIVLSENSDLSNALAEEEDDFAHMKLKHIISTINKHVDKTIRAQIITPEYLIFARSWDEDNTYAGMPLEVYRSDLDEVKKYKKPRVSIEVGRRLGIKATVPVYKENKLLGFIEVLRFFDESTSFFHKLGIDLYVLLDDNYYNTAVFMQNNPSVAQYIVANRSMNMVNLKLLQRSDFKKLRQERVLHEEKKYIFYEPMHNGQAEIIGAFVFVLSQKSLERFSRSSDNLSFLLAFSRNDLYAIVKKEEYENRVYISVYDKALLSLKDTVPHEDRELFIEGAKEVLSSYTKEELIAMMLHYKISRRIKGKIK
ncbi:MAG: hypothetical protein COA44_14875 [Arcobacter sp.]|nr:MAG: hypothetical protein COA44_14875 [Arcobacter sp.]